MMAVDELAARQSAIDALQRETLHALVTGQPLTDVMRGLCERVEALAPEALCSVIAIDAQARLDPLAAPRLPAEYSAALVGLPIGPNVGSCGTAAWRGEAVEVQDIATDPLWADFREFALGHGLRACWSSPVVMPDGRVVATFALYYREPRAVAPFHREMVQACLQLTQIAFAHHERERRIHALAFYDEVTGLPNRSLFSARARQTLELAERQASPLAVLMFDLDRFKTINDALGHAVGDQLLAQIGRLLTPRLRTGDTLARFGGDEFAVLLPGCDVAAARRVADKLHEALLEPLLLEGGVHQQQSISIGMAVYPQDGEDVDTLLRHADVAMYEAKRAGRRTTRHFIGQMTEALEERMRIEAALQGAWAQRAFTLHYQPKLRLLDGALVGVEALVRWNVPGQRPVPPDVFIPIAEECGLVNALDAWVLEQALGQLAAWRAAGIEVPSLAVNASPTRFYRDDVVGHTTALLARHGLGAAQLTMEITERLLLGQDSRSAEQIAALHEMGVRLSVDDFGTGYSSLGYLKRLPVSELKLDRSFVRDLEADADDRALARAVISIGSALELHVVAEGVETPAQYDFLCSEGCSAGQGWLFARPMTVEAFEAWYRAERPWPPA
jgi:diguanylate cyclase (GGDEF)-like protein